jgi:hypothetical protein
MNFKEGLLNVGNTLIFVIAFMAIICISIGLQKATIAKDETSLRMHFYMQKETTVYIHPYEPEEYYIDLEFLENS